MVINVLMIVFAVAALALAVVCWRMYLRLKDMAATQAQLLAQQQKPAPAEPAKEEQPIAKVEEPAQPEVVAAEDKPVKASILVVGDDAELRDELKKNFSQEYVVLVATSGDEGFSLACQYTPDIVISDVMMPGMGGYELCGKLREHEETSHIAIILVSALGERENIIYGLEAGADDYVTKPCDMAVLRSRIHTIMKRHQTYRESPLTTNSISKMDYKSKLDKAFMEKVVAIIEKRLGDSEFSVNELCGELAMSRSSVFNKVKALTGKGPNDVIKAMRLDKAHELLLSRELNVGEVAFSVGFSDPKYFSTCFKKQFGLSPNKV